MNKLLNIGVSPSMPEDVVQRYNISNFIVFFYFIFAIVFTVIIYNYYPTLMLLPIIGLVMMLVSLLLNYLHINSITLIILNIGLPLIVAILHSSLIGKDEEPILSINLLHLSMQVMPWLCYKAKDRIPLTFMVIINFIIFMATSTFMNSLLEFSVDSSLWRGDIISNITVVSSFILLSGALYFLNLQKHWEELKNNQLLHSLKTSKKEIEKSKEELSVLLEEIQLTNGELIEQKEELQMQALSLQEANGKINNLYSEIKESIKAAYIIQRSILPSETTIKKYLPESFILYKPKDVVSGDFYWFDVKDDYIIIAAVDCTGHGVSGAFMSINGHHLINQAIYSHKEMIAGDILNRLNEGIIKALNHQEGNDEIMDGMDIALCIIDKDKKTMQYAGANNPLYINRNNEIIQVKANRFAIGKSITGKVQTFVNNEIELLKGDIIYIFSDGYADQIGGKEGLEKFNYIRYRELLVNIAEKDMDGQLRILDDNLTNWRLSQEQLDDVLVIGFKI